ncbi:hypothetical protein MBELCI_2044 [Limimaricola cinnabarinus LL-001]|uniref:Uncharacterized protein n=1 Tax=Limimaricola cinnabarinus LL-001 TaxID=1337093 RepID=U2Z4J5_9RHOB|nr:hypothetical protein MBELCI_2044 [Limimaricola cinnabarinus LL-001]
MPRLNPPEPTEALSADIMGASTVALRMPVLHETGLLASSSPKGLTHPSSCEIH